MSSHVSPNVSPIVPSIASSIGRCRYKEHGVMAMAPEVGPECMTCARVNDMAGFWPNRGEILSLAQETWPLNVETAWVAGQCEN